MNTKTPDLENVVEFDDALQEVMHDFLSRRDEDRETTYGDLMKIGVIQEALKKLAEGDVEGFHYSFMYPLNELADTVIKRGVPTCHELRFIFGHYRFVSIQFRNFMELHEGSACCADKAGTIIRAIIRFYMTGEPITFDYSQKYTFHLPTKVLTTHDEIIGFFTAVYSLYYGRPFDFIARYQYQERT